MNKMLVNEEEEKEEEINPFGLWVKKHRDELGMSLADVAEAAGDVCSDVYLNILENNKRGGKKGNFKQPDEEIVRMVAIALKRPLDEALIKANYAPKTKETLEILESVDFSVFNSKGINEIKNIINAMPYLRPEFIKQNKQSKEETERGDKVELVASATFPRLEDTKKIRHLPEEIATENAVGKEKNLLTEKGNQSNITEPYNDITPSPGRQKIVMKKARYAAKQEPDVAADEEAA